MSNTKFACFYFEAFANINAVAQKSFCFSPQVYLLPPKAVVVEFGKSHRLFSEREFFERANALFRNDSESFSIGRSDKALFSYIQAKFGCSDILEAPLIALLDVIDPLERNHVVRKKIGKLIATLTKAQIPTVRHFRNIPRNQIPSRFGGEALTLKSRIDGEFLPSFELVKQIDKFSAREELPSSYNGTLGFLISVIEGILKDKIFPPLRKIGGKVESIEIAFLFEKNSRHNEERRIFPIQFVQPQFKAEDTISIIWTCVETSLQRKPIHYSTPILYIEVEVTKWLIDSDEQTDFFDEAKRRKEKEYVVLARHKNRYGDENIFRPELTEDRRPDFSWRKILDPKAELRKIDPKLIPRRPIFRLPNPHLIHISKDRTSLRKGNQPPLEIALWEPMTEILASHWFDNEEGKLLNTYNRAYSRVHLKIGRELSVFQAADGRFYLDGYSG